MNGGTNKELLNRIESKLDGVSREVAEIKLEMALKFSNSQNAQDTRFNNFQNEHDKRFTSLERYLRSDPDTNQEGAIEKLERIENSVKELETNAKVQGAKYGGAISVIISVLWWIISKIIA